MSNKARKRKPSFIPAIVSITLVLFIIGLLGMVSLYANKLIDYLKENVQVVLYLNTGTEAEKVEEIRKEITSYPFVKQTKVVSSDEAAAMFKDELGEDFTEVLGGNPLPPSIEVYLKGTNLNRQTMDSLVASFKLLPMVYEVSSQGDLIDEINKNKERLTYAMLVLGVILLLVAFVLMNSTVRLAVYSKRFIIKSMQLVGATEWFIIKPFIKNSVIWVFIGAVIATLLSVSIYYYGAHWLQKNVFIQNENLFTMDSFLTQLPLFAGLFAFLLLIGLVVIIPGTYVSTKRYLSLKIDDLY
jgi:cell division transport system permease protein